MGKQQLIEALEKRAQVEDSAFSHESTSAKSTATAGVPAPSPTRAGSLATDHLGTAITDDAALGEYRKRLRDLRAQIVVQIKRSASAVAQDGTAPGGLNTAPTQPSESGGEGLQSAISIAQMEQDKVDQIDMALRRTETGTYGVCYDCGRTISMERLKRIPYARYCEECAESHEGSSS